MSYYPEHLNRECSYAVLTERQAGEVTLEEYLEASEECAEEPMIDVADFK